MGSCGMARLNFPGGTLHRMRHIYLFPFFCMELEDGYYVGKILKGRADRNYWLRLVRDSGFAPREDVEDLIRESIELIKILTSIVKTGQESLK